MPISRTRVSGFPMTGMPGSSAVSDLPGSSMPEHHLRHVRAFGP